MHKIINYLFGVLFVVSAALQYNDPDPYLWIPIYLAAAVVCFMAANKRYYPKITLLLLGLYLIYAAYLLFDNNGPISWATEHNAENIAQSMKAESPWIEETREFFGLLILIALMLYNYLVAIKRKVN